MPRRLAVALALVASVFLSSCQICDGDPFPAKGDGGIEVCNKRGGGTERCWVIYP